MSKDETAPINIDNLSDEEVNNLSADDVASLMEQEAPNEQETEEVEDTVEEDDSSDTSGNDDEDDDNDTSDSNESSDDEESEDKDTHESEEDKPDEDSDKSETSESDDKSSKDGQEDEVEPKEKSSTSKEADKKPKEKSDNAGESEVTSEAMSDFYKKMTAPFKADGKDIQIRSAEDAIRLMQMGTNYSKRMQELKPLRAMNEMLEQHGLNDPVKLAFLIDVQSGKPEAIQKLLKDNKIDPLDIDTSKDSSYQATDYTPDQKVTNFKQAIKDTMDKEGGKELISEIADTNGVWDDESKETLKENPSTFDNLLEQKKSGMYTQIVTELTYQKTLGHLSNVPFLQAYHAVGQAMEKAGVFGPKTKDTSISTAEPIDTGPRKAKTTKPNPDLSSTKQPRTTKTVKTEDTRDYFSMSDEDIMSMAPPG